MGVRALSGESRAVFLDRDGVLNQCRVIEGKPYPPERVEDLRIIADAGTACQRLRDAGFVLVVVTNQPDIARGAQNAEVVEAMHSRLREELPLSAVYVCPHDDVDHCDCRKPQPGMILRAASDLGIDLSRSYMVGDRWRDVNCGRSAGCRTAFIQYDYDEQLRDQPTVIVGTLSEAAAWILSDAVDPERI